MWTVVLIFLSPMNWVNLFSEYFTGNWRWTTNFNHVWRRQFLLGDWGRVFCDTSRLSRRSRARRFWNQIFTCVSICRWNYLHSESILSLYSIHSWYLPVCMSNLILLPIYSHLLNSCSWLFGKHSQVHSIGMVWRGFVAIVPMFSSLEQSLLVLSKLYWLL